MLEQQPRQRRDDRRLAAAADDEVADTDDRAIETAPATADAARTRSVAAARRRP